MDINSTVPLSLRCIYTRITRQSRSAYVGTSNIMMRIILVLLSLSGFPLSIFNRLPTLLRLTAVVLVRFLSLLVWLWPPLSWHSWPTMDSYDVSNSRTLSHPIYTDTSHNTSGEYLLFAFKLSSIMVHPARLSRCKCCRDSFFRSRTTGIG